MSKRKRTPMRKRKQLKLRRMLATATRPLIEVIYLVKPDLPDNPLPN